MKAVIFSGQGSQQVGMGRILADKISDLQSYRTQCQEVLGYDLIEVMTTGTEEELRQTKVTQPALYVYGSLLFNALHPDCQAVAGHSLGEYAALYAGGYLNFQTGLSLVKVRAEAMQAACEASPSTMAAVLGLEDQVVIQILQSIQDDIVVPANQNCPGQIIISGTLTGIARATELLKEAGAKRVLPLSVGGAFHSPLMQSAKDALDKAIDTTTFATGTLPIYQNVDGKPSTDPTEIKAKLKAQMISPVLWTVTIQHMAQDGFTTFLEPGPGAVLQGLVKKISREAEVGSL